MKLHRYAFFLVLLFPFCDAQSGFAQGLPSEAPLTARERILLERLEQLEKRVAILESKDGGMVTGLAVAPPQVTEQVALKAAAKVAAPPVQGKDIPDFGHTTVNFGFDGYYGYNFNSPIGRDNLLRAYDVSSNSFSINQADIVIENTVDLDAGKRYGARVDLQYGQATQTLQGNAVNEPRPDIYRAIFQAYGTYVLPVGKGLTVDFGKFASSLGIEGNYTKDQVNYSRSFWFSYLPFYHTGLRANYQFSDAFAVNYWTVNGTQQTEAFNGFKDQYFGLVIKPHKSVTWNVNYYLGQEHPDVVYYSSGVPAGAPANLPTLQGVPFQPIVDPPTGKLHIFDSYATWQASANLSFAAEADYVIMRDQKTSAPLHTDGGAVYARYQLGPKCAFAARGEYLSDRGGMFSGMTQALKEATATLDYKVSEGLLIRQEWRRDFSNQPYFLTETLGILRKEQTTATMGLVWWFGPKKGIW